MVTDSEEPPSALTTLFSEWEREKSLLLQLKHWRLILEADDNPKIDRQTIEIHANYKRGFSGDDFTIGEAAEKLADLSITVGIVRAGDIIADEIVQANAKRKAELEPDSRERTEFTGWMNYYKPSDFAGTSEGSIVAKVILSAPSFDYIRGRICAAEIPDLTMQLKVRFPTDDNHWDGKGMIDVSKLVVVFPHNCDATGEPLYEPFDDGVIDDDEVIDARPDGAALQLAVSNNIAANLVNIRKTIMWGTAAIIFAIIVFR